MIWLRLSRERDQAPVVVEAHASRRLRVLLKTCLVERLMRIKSTDIQNSYADPMRKYVRRTEPRKGGRLVNLRYGEKDAISGGTSSLDSSSQLRYTSPIAFMLVRQQKPSCWQTPDTATIDVIEKPSKLISNSDCIRQNT
ncbi:hypothetical protein TNCV_4777071 [Trichonephila clavipes]|nr:hypothetical protein TNCV_4777071 [Trichonephila clavipes]